MSTTYYSHVTHYETGFRVSVAGGLLIGEIHKSLGLPLSESYGVWDKDSYRVPFVADKELAIGMAAKLRAQPRSVFESLYKTIPANNYFNGTIQEFVSFVDSWIEFLESCDGYDSDPIDD